MTFAVNVSPPLEAGGLSWSHQGTLWATIIVKAGYSIAADGALEAVDADLLGPGELVPFVDRAQLAVATTFPRTGMGRAAMLRGNAVLLDKRVYQGSELGPRPPWMAIDAHGVARLPDQLDRRAFQMVAADQLFDQVLPGDRIVLDNLDERGGMRMLVVPGDAPRVTATLRGRSLEVPMRCDTLSVDDRPRLSLVWHGFFTLPDARAFEELTADVVLQVGAAPPPDEVLATVALPTEEPVEGTVGIDDIMHSLAPPLPFKRSDMLKKLRPK